MAVIEAIQTTYLEADAASVTFGSIPATYEHLQLRMSCRSSREDTVDILLVQFNSDTGFPTTYTTHYMDATGSSATAAAVTGSYYFGGYPISANTALATEYSTVHVDILDYANSDKNTTAMGTMALGSAGRLEFGSLLWDNTAAVTDILIKARFGPNWVRGSEFSLYGLNSS